MTNRDYNNKDLGDIFEPTHKDGVPTWSMDWADALIILGFVLFFTGILFNII